MYVQKHIQFQKKKVLADVYLLKYAKWTAQIFFDLCVKSESFSLQEFGLQKSVTKIMQPTSPCHFLLVHCNTLTHKHLYMYQIYTRVKCTYTHT